MKFSIVTPSFNQGKWIADCLQSVKSSLDRPSLAIEHFVADGASSDHTFAILKDWQDRHPEDGHYRFGFISETDRGQTHAINKGLAQSSGDILSYLCSDDLLESGALADVEKVFRERPEVEVVYGDYFFLEGDSGWKRLKKAQPFNLATLHRHNFISQPATFWRRSVYEKFGGFDESLRYCMDHEYWLRLGGKVKWHYLEKPLASMRLHADAKSSASLGEAWRETHEMSRRYGLEKYFHRKALWMNWGGQWFYRFKRVLFRNLGKMRSTRA